MAAILAILNRDSEPVSLPVLEAMLAASQQRAVDGQNRWVEGQIALGHQHFWVTPEEEGEIQPLAAADGLVVLACDARLDNRQVLRAALGLATREEQEASDAGLILNAYRRWGVDCAAHLLGDFCFALWDVERQHLFVAVDALGARSLCTYIDERRFLVASEIESLLAHPGVQPRMNEQKVAEFLAGLWGNHEDTFYEGLTYCPPAHCLLVTADSLRRWRYWDLDPEARVRYPTDREYSEHYLELLREAVRCRLRSTGQVGISLSGGLDSTALAALSTGILPKARVPRQRLRTFSYVFNELKACDERPYIEMLVDRYSLAATHIACDDKWTLADSDRWPVDRGFVLSDPYAWLPEAVIGAAQEAGCRLLLSGHYGDVLFVARQYWAAELVREVRLGQLGQILRRHAAETRLRSDLWNFGLRALVPRWLRRTYRRLSPRRVAGQHPGLHPDFIKRTSLQERFVYHPGEQRFARPGQWARYQSLTLNVFSQGAAAVRKAYNRRGLELETPYWDRRLIEFAMALPADQLGRPGVDRWVHRNAMMGLLPEPVRQRRHRTNFLPLMAKGLFTKEKQTVRRILTNPEIVRRQMVRADWIEETLRGAQLSSPDWSLLWRCISLELWLKRYC